MNYKHNYGNTGNNKDIKPIALLQVTINLILSL